MQACFVVRVPRIRTFVEAPSRVFSILSAPCSKVRGRTFAFRHLRAPLGCARTYLSRAQRQAIERLTHLASDQGTGRRLLLRAAGAWFRGRGWQSWCRNFGHGANDGRWPLAYRVCTEKSSPPSVTRESASSPSPCGLDVVTLAADPPWRGNSCPGETARAAYRGKGAIRRDSGASRDERGPGCGAGEHHPGSRGQGRSAGLGRSVLSQAASEGRQATIDRCAPARPRQARNQHPPLGRSLGGKMVRAPLGRTDQAVVTEHLGTRVLTNQHRPLQVGDQARPERARALEDALTEIAASGASE